MKITIVFVLEIEPVNDTPRLTSCYGFNNTDIDDPSIYDVDGYWDDEYFYYSGYKMRINAEKGNLTITNIDLDDDIISKRVYRRLKKQYLRSVSTNALICAIWQLLSKTFMWQRIH